MGISERGRSTRYQVIEDEDENSYSENAGSDSDSGSDIDPSYNIFEDTYDKFSNLSIKKKSKPRITKDPVELEDTSYKSDEKDPEEVHKIIEAGQLEKLKVEQCKIYLRKNGLRLTGNKETLIQRIKEHQEILNGGGENKYPVSSFVLNCKGDACTGDVVMFEQNVYEMFNIASRAATGPPCGTRTVAGRIVKESYGAAKQQHTFTIEVLWSKGEKPLAPLHPLLIKGRNLYRLKTLRQRWEDEGERQKILMEKHLRGSLARSDRELRIQEKERRKVLRATRIKRKNEPYNNQSQSKSNVIANSVIQFHQLGSSVTMGKAAPQQPGVSINPGNTETQVQKSELVIASRKPVIQSQQSGYSVTSVVDAGTLQPQQNRGQIQDRNQNQIPQKVEKSDVSQGEDYRQPNVYSTWHQCSTNDNNYPNKRLSESSDRNYHQLPLRSKRDDTANFLHPNIYMHNASFPINDKKPYTNRMNESCELNYPMLPLRSRNHHGPENPALYRPMCSPDRYGRRARQVCWHYSRGRCYHGDNCKFLHELRGEEQWSSGQGRF